MDYLQIKLFLQSNEEYIADLLASYLGEIGYESFEEEVDGILAYVPRSKFDEELLKQVLMHFPYSEGIRYEKLDIEGVNWNEEWEKNYFQPIVISDLCVIHSSFHKDIPSLPYDIIIDPKMSFGTGHHETTSLMIEAILTLDLKGKSLLDMGCGTAVLAILAAMRGAEPITAIDNDPWCAENSAENIDKNNTDQIEVLLGGAELLEGRKYDVVLANINRNILLNDMKHYTRTMGPGAELLMSGFYREDIPVIEAEANRLGLELVSFAEKNNWVCVKTLKKA